MSEFRRSLRSWDEYWFGYGSPVSLGVYRILLGALAVVNQLFLLSQFDSWFSDRGFTPAWMGQLWLNPMVPVAPGVSVPRIDVINGVTNDGVVLAVLVLVGLAALFTCLGIFTRVSSIVLAIGLISIHNRNPVILHGGDTVVRLGAMYLAMAPAGRACSIDRLWRLWHGRDSVALTPVSLWPQRVIAFNVALLYFTTTWLKWFGTLWRNGSATWYPNRLPEFYRFPVPQFMNEFPMVTVTTYGTLLTEFALGTLVFIRPCRKWVLLGGVMMHLYIDYSMNIPLFSYLMISTYVVFYEGTEVSAWAKRVGERFRQWRVTVIITRPLAEGPSRVLAAVDPLNLVTYEVGPEAGAYAGGLRSVGAWPWAWIPGVWRRVISAATVKSQ